MLYISYLDIFVKDQRTVLPLILIYCLAERLNNIRVKLGSACFLRYLLATHHRKSLLFFPLLL